MWEDTIYVKCLKAKWYSTRCSRCCGGTNIDVVKLKVKCRDETQQTGGSGGFWTEGGLKEG